MRKIIVFVISFTLVFMILSIMNSCERIKQYDQKPELESLRQGIRLSAAVAYCASIANSAFRGEQLPNNVIFNENSGLLYIEASPESPIPFNRKAGSVVVSCIWQNGSGVMSILFADIDLLDNNFNLYGLYMIPFKEREEGKMLTLFAKQDIILGSGSDTILDLSNISNETFNAEIDRLETNPASDVFVAVQQNFWHIIVEKQNANPDVYNNDITVNGGGQIAEVEGASGGLIYHAALNLLLNHSVCDKNPIEGNALSQNFKAGGVPYIDLGNSFLSFKDICDGNVYVEWSTGVYRNYNNTSIPLGL